MVCDLYGALESVTVLRRLRNCRDIIIIVFIIAINGVYAGVLLLILRMIRGLSVCTCVSAYECSKAAQHTAMPHIQKITAKWQMLVGSTGLCMVVKKCSLSRNSGCVG